MNFKKIRLYIPNKDTNMPLNQYNDYNVIDVN